MKHLHTLKNKLPADLKLQEAESHSPFPCIQMMLPIKKDKKKENRLIKISVKALKNMTITQNNRQYYFGDEIRVPHNAPDEEPVVSDF